MERKFKYQLLLFISSFCLSVIWLFTALLLIIRSGDVVATVGEHGNTNIATQFVVFALPAIHVIIATMLPFERVRSAGLLLSVLMLAVYAVYFILTDNSLNSWYAITLFSTGALTLPTIMLHRLPYAAIGR